MTENDKVSLWEKMTKNDWKWHSKDQIYVLKLMWYLNINYSTSKMLKNAKKAEFHQHTKQLKMNKNESKWNKMRQKGPKSCSDTDEILKSKLFNL